MLVQLLSVLLLFLLSGCGSLQERLAELSAPEVSCAQSDIEISETFSTRSASRYKATCSDGKAYRCISMGKPFGDEPETTCQPIGDDAEEATASSAGAAGRAAPRGVLSGGWPRVRVEDCSAELTMPPGAMRVDEVEPAQGMPVHKVDAAAGGSSFGFVCVRLPGLPEARRPADEIVASAARGAVDAVNGELLQSRKLTGVTGRSLLVRVQGAQMAMRIWIQGDWAYTATVVPIDKLPAGAVAEYLDRIEISSNAR